METKASDVRRTYKWRVKFSTTFTVFNTAITSAHHVWAQTESEAHKVVALCMSGVPCRVESIEPAEVVPPECMDLPKTDQP